MPDDQVPLGRDIYRQASENERDEENYEEFDAFDDKSDLQEEPIGVEITEADQEAFDRLNPQDTEPRQTLADIILAKIREHEQGKDAQEEEEEEPKMPPKVVEVYSRVGMLLSRYRSGKLPKAFKIIPALPIGKSLYLTRPDEWTPNATYEATKLLVSSLSPAQCQRYFHEILLERVREDIEHTKKLNYHLYRALVKGLFKPAAWFKGILFPLCQPGRLACTLKEAAIIGSVLTRTSVPVLHAAAALLKLAEMDYSGPTSLFIRILLDKKYALPYKVVDALVFHFIKQLTTEDLALPVLFHQSFLSFAQRYKNDVTEEQREALLDVNNSKYGHHAIAPEIRRELTANIQTRQPDSGNVQAMEM